MTSTFKLFLAGLLFVPAAVVTVAGPALATLPSRLRVRKALREAAERYGFDPDWFDAIGRVESWWRLSAINMSGTDGARGGAWGPTQITDRTARAYGYTGPMQAFREDAELAAKWTGIIMRAGHPASLADAVAWWNAGRTAMAKVPAENTARTVYYPKAIKALAWVKEHPV